MTYRAVSLFSGCGGFCEGVRLAGFETVAAVEIDRFAAETYRHNFPETPLFEGDIASFLKPSPPSWVAREPAFARVAAGSVQLVFGGPPCQGYSQIGTRLLDDPRNSLYREFIRVLSALRAPVFLMENVPNMLLLNKGLFKRQVLEAFAEAGYSNTDVRVLAASDYGVPQVRKRAIFFGVRDGSHFPYRAGDWLDAALAGERRPETTVQQAIGDLPAEVSTDGEPMDYPQDSEMNWIRDELRLDREGAYYSASAKQARAGALRLYNHHTKEIQDRRRELIRHLLPGMKGNSLPTEVWNGLRPEKWRRLHPDRPTYTILAQMHRDLSEWVHPNLDRWITVREAARLQSFHDGFVFRTSEWQMLKQIGNAVPPLMARGIAIAALQALRVLDGKFVPQDEAPLPLALGLG